MLFRYNHCHLYSYLPTFAYPLENEHIFIFRKMTDPSINYELAVETLPVAQFSQFLADHPEVVSKRLINLMNGSILQQSLPNFY